MIAPPFHVEPVPRRVRATIGNRTVLDTIEAIYVWEWPNYPQFHIPIADVDADLLVDEKRTETLAHGTVRLFGLRVGDEVRPTAARLFTDESLEQLPGTVRFEWGSLDAWYEEDERVFVHPRNPYTRVDALRSTRHVTIAVDEVVLAESSGPVLVFETGLPTRYYVDPSCVRFQHLERTETRSSCPYKGRTTAYWSARLGDALHEDLAWTYDFPTRQLQPIAGLIAFYNEGVDITVDGVAQERPTTHLR